MLDFGRATGMLDNLYGTFARHSSHRPREETNEDETGKAIPDPVIPQLDAPGPFWPRFPYRDYVPEDVAAMFLAVYRAQWAPARKVRSLPPCTRRLLAVHRRRTEDGHGVVRTI